MAIEWENIDNERYVIIAKHLLIDLYRDTDTDYYLYCKAYNIELCDDCYIEADTLKEAKEIAITIITDESKDIMPILGKLLKEVNNDDS